MTDDEQAIRDLIEAHRDSIERQIYDALLADPERSVAVVLLLARDDPRFYLVAEETAGVLLDSTREELGEFWSTFKEELTSLFTVTLERGQEIVLLAQPHTGYVSRIRIRTCARAQARARRVVRDWHCPLDTPRSASHVELLAMNTAHAWAVMHKPDGDSPVEEQISSELIDLAVRKKMPEYDRIVLRIHDLLFLPDVEAAVAEDTLIRTLDVHKLEFFCAWRESTFARLEVGHKLAASLCLTDIPGEIQVAAPWKAWSLVVPNGLFPPDIAPSGKSVELSRVWCVGAKPVFCVTSLGYVFEWKPSSAGLPREGEMLLALVRGACLALSNPEEFRKESRRHHHRARGNGRSGPPDLDQARFLLSAPVNVDLREHVAAAVSGKTNASPKVQFLVRGHWRNQSYGPRNTLRRAQWIQPFWKGPNGGPILHRPHRL